MTMVDRITQRVNIANPLGDVVQSVEQASHEIAGAVSGLEKRAAAVELVVNALKLRIIPKWLQRLAIGKVVDALVDQFNTEYGRNWGAAK